MIEKYSVRTDLALEQKERFESDNVEVQGVILEEDYDEEREIRITKVKIETEKGAKTMGKPVGTYLTLEAPNLAVPDEDYHREVSVDNLNITRHIVKEYGKYAMGEEHVHMTSAIVPGVMAQTGMETLEIVKGIVKETKPDFVIAIDALAARNSKRLNRTIQIADTGINPGSGVGNHRNGLTKETLGVPVIGVGVPTVVDAATIVNDTMENFVAALESSETLKGVGVVLQGYTANEKYELIRELIAPHLNGMFVTPKDIDETVKRISYTISEGLNLMFASQA